MILDLKPWVFLSGGPSYYFLAFGRDRVSWLSVIEIVLIHFSSIEVRPKGRFGLTINWFLNYLIKAF